jgi:hypothetical protein
VKRWQLRTRALRWRGLDSVAAGIRTEVVGDAGTFWSVRVVALLVCR